MMEVRAGYDQGIFSVDKSRFAEQSEKHEGDEPQLSYGGKETHAYSRMQNPRARIHEGTRNYRELLHRIARPK